jgi:hypothetical protein
LASVLISFSISSGKYRLCLSMSSDMTPIILICGKLGHEKCRGAFKNRSST